MQDPRWDQIFIPGGKGGIPLPKVGSRHSLGSWVGLPGSHLYPASQFTWGKHKEISHFYPNLFISLAYILFSCSTEVKQWEKSGSAANKPKLDPVEEPGTSGVSSTSKIRKFKGKEKRKITF